MVLPREKISVAMETKKVYAFGANGANKTIRTLIDLLKESLESAKLWQILLQSMCFAD